MQALLIMLTGLCMMLFGIGVVSEADLYNEQHSYTYNKVNDMRKHSKSMAMQRHARILYLRTNVQTKQPGQENYPRDL